MTPTVNTLATLIEDVGPSGFPSFSVGSGAGQNLVCASERIVGSNSVVPIGGVYYVVILLGTGSPLTYGYQVYRSTDEGTTWSTYGSPLAPTDYGGGMSVLAIGTDIYIAYSNQLKFGTTSSEFLTLAIFDTVAGTWGAEDRFDCGLSPIGGTFRVEGPYEAKLRSDGTIVFILADTLSGYPHAVVYDIATVSWIGPFQLSSLTESFEASVLVAADDHVYVICTDGFPPTFRVLGIDATNLVDTPASISYTGQILNWLGFGLEAGFEDGTGNFYFAAAVQTASYPTIWGRPCILYGSPSGGWTLGPQIDPAADADLSVYSCSLILKDDTLLYFWRGVTSDGLSYVERLGWAPAGSHASPLDWTWTTFYDFASPSPAVSGQTAPYETYPPPNSGMSAGLTVDPDRIHFVTTIKGADGELFTIYLAGIDVDDFGNGWYFGGAFFAQGS